MGRAELKASDHPDKDVRKALREILKMEGGKQFRLVRGGHWGLIFCRHDCCMITVDGTPRNAHNHVEELYAEARKCPRNDDDPTSRRRFGRRKR